MMNGTLGIFQKFWELIGTIYEKEENDNSSENEIKNQNLSLKNDLFRVRNSQISMVSIKNILNIKILNKYLKR